MAKEKEVGLQPFLWGDRGGIDRGRNVKNVAP